MPSSPHIHLRWTPNMAATLIQNESCLILLIKALYYTATLRENKNLDFVHFLCYFSILKILVFVWLTGEAKLMLPFQNHSFFVFKIIENPWHLSQSHNACVFDDLKQIEHFLVTGAPLRLLFLAQSKIRQSVWVTAGAKKLGTITWKSNFLVISVSILTQTLLSSQLIDMAKLMPPFEKK